MKINRALAMALVTFSLAGLPALSAEAKPMRLPVSSLGSGVAPDKSAAMSAAKDNAEAMLICAGAVEGLKTTSTGCIQTGDNYTCTAASVATCVIGN